MNSDHLVEILMNDSDDQDKSSLNSDNQYVTPINYADDDYGERTSNALMQMSALSSDK